MSCFNRSIKDFHQNPTPPIIPRDQYIPPQIATDIGSDIARLQPGAGQNATPAPQTLYDMGRYYTPFRWLWRRPANTLSNV